MSRQVWIGLFGLTVEQGNEVLTDCAYAYVNALSVAESKDDFIFRVNLACQSLRFCVDEIEDVEPFLKRIENYEVSEDIHRLAEEAELEGVVVFDTFHGSASGVEDLSH